MMRKLVIMLAPSLNAVSGITTHINQLFNSSLGQTYELEHFQVGSEGRSENPKQKLWRFISSPFELGWRVMRRRPDIVHINTAFNLKAVWRDLVYLWVCKLFGRCVIFQIHGGLLPHEFAHGSRIIEWILKRSLALPDAVVLLASNEATPYREFTKIHHLSIIPNAIDLSEYKSLPAKDFNAETLKLVYIGRLAEEKGIQHALQAFSALRGEPGIPSLRFIIAGSGPFEAELRQQALTLGVEDYVQFAGPLFGEEKLKFWREADIFVFPTFHQEGLPYAILESIASGTPVLTTRVGAAPDVLRDGEHGLFIEPHDPAGLAVVLRGLVTDRDLLRRMSRACRQRARRAYNIERLASDFDRLYKKLLNDNTA